MCSSSNSHHQESLYFLLRAIPHPKPSFATSASILGCWWEQDSRYDRLDSIGESVLVQGTNHIRLQTLQLKKGEELQSHLPVFFTSTWMESLNTVWMHGIWGCIFCLASMRKKAKTMRFESKVRLKLPKKMNYNIKLLFHWEDFEVSILQ